MSWSRLGHLVTAWVLTIIATVPANRLQSCFETLAWLLHLLAEFPFIYSNPIKVTDKPITPYWLEHPFWSLGNGLHHEGHGILRHFIDYVGNHSIFSGGLLEHWDTSESAGTRCIRRSWLGFVRTFGFPMSYLTTCSARTLQDALGKWLTKLALEATLELPFPLLFPGRGAQKPRPLDLSWRRLLASA